MVSYIIVNTPVLIWQQETKKQCIITISMKTTPFLQRSSQNTNVGTKHSVYWGLCWEPRCGFYWNHNSSSKTLYNNVTDNTTQNLLEEILELLQYNLYQASQQRHESIQSLLITFYEIQTELHEHNTSGQHSHPHVIQYINCAKYKPNQKQVHNSGLILFFFLLTSVVNCRWCLISLHTRVSVAVTVTPDGFTF